jgi:hypothetical protein
MDIQALSKILPNFVASLRRNANYDYQSEVMDSLHVTYRSFFHSFVGILLRQHQITRFLTTRKWQTVIMNDFFLPCAAIDSAAYEQVVTFLLNAFRLVASSGRAGSIGDSFSNLGRWLETLYANRPESTISDEKNVSRAWLLSFPLYWTYMFLKKLSRRRLPFPYKLESNFIIISWQPF